MRLRIINLLLFFIASPSLILSQEHWDFINDGPPHVKVYSTYVIGNTAYFWCEQNIVFKTSDGGESFEVLSSYAPVDDNSLGCCDNHGIAFADQMIGYITDAGQGEFRTEDAGKTWMRTAEAGSSVSLIEFASPEIGWKAGGGGVYKTNNAGLTWKFINTPLFDPAIFSNIFALDERNVWILKSDYNWNKPNGGIWHSKDGGAIWKKVQTGITVSGSDQIEYSDLLIRKSGEGIAIGRITRQEQGERKSFIITTNDFGETWRSFEFNDCYLKNINAIDDSTWVVQGNTINYYYTDNRIIQFRSTDHGNSWEESYPIFLPNNYIQLYSSLFLPGFETILVSTSNGIYKSKDKGNTYSLIKTKLDLYVEDFCLDKKPVSNSSQLMMAWSYNRNYLFSQDAGFSWTKKELPEETGFRCWNAKISEDVIYIIMDQLRLYKSIDKGETWSRINIPSHFSGIRALDVFDKKSIALQSYPDICVSNDGGDTWINSPFPGNFWLNEASMIGTNKIVGVGGFYGTNKTYGYLFNTQNQGLSWQIIDVDYEMKHVNMVTDYTGYALGDLELYKTINSGKSWEKIKTITDFSKPLDAFYFYDSLHGLLSQRYSFWETKNGGNTWDNVDYNFPFRETNRLGVNKNGTLFAIGNGSLLAKSFYNSQNKLINTHNILSEQFVLFQNSPNPFNPSTKISFLTQDDGYVKLNVYNILGELVLKLVDGYLDAGSYSYEFTANNLSSGIYLYLLSFNGQIKTKKMNFIK